MSTTRATVTPLGQCIAEQDWHEGTMSRPDEPTITIVRLLLLQACIPAEWTDAQVEELAEDEQPCGTRAGWSVYQSGCRVRCTDREGFVHVMVKA